MSFVILASQSPRRRELLKRLGLRVTVCPAHINEIRLSGESPSRYTLRLAMEKAAAIAAAHPRSIVIAADTAVIHRNRIFGKPANIKDARRILTALCGTRHEVISSIAVINGHSARRFLDLDRSFVTARRLSPGRISTLARKHLDKAGAYAVQEKSDRVITRIEGSYFTVVGLPVHQLRHILRLCGIRVRSIPEPVE